MRNTRARRVFFRALPRRRRPSVRRLSPISWGLVVCAIVLFTIGIFVSVDSWRTNRKAEATVKKLQTTTNTNNAQPAGDTPPKTNQPSPNDLSLYQVAPTKPRIVSIPKIGVKARILPEGVSKDGSLAAPSNVYDTGWYAASSLPGQQGAMLLDGHVSSWTTEGVFYNLKKLQAGDVVMIERGDAKTYQYKVVKTQTYSADAVDMNAAITPVVPGTPGLNLITCGGKVKPGTSEFTDRIVVFTQQIT
jgi:LPXTG-site transpeptidase (sortase) family protein